jgi:hypothetical protein
MQFRIQGLGFTIGLNCLDHAPRTLLDNNYALDLFCYYSLILTSITLATQCDLYAIRCCLYVQLSDTGSAKTTI